jgi:group I intron endonuclease
MQRYGSIYLITNTVTAEQYVGQTRLKNVNTRWRNHVNCANSQVVKKYKLANAITQYGKQAFVFEEIYQAFDAKALNDAEIQFITDLNPAYNIAKGGAGHRGVIPSPELCNQRSVRLKLKWSDPVWRSKQIERIKENAQTEAAKERGKKVAQIGTKARWENHVKKVKPAKKIKHVQVKKDPQVVRELTAKLKWKPVYCPQLQCSFLSRKAAAEHLGVLRTSISNAIKQKGVVAKMYTMESVI